MLWHPKTLQNLAMYNVFFIFGRFSIAGKLPKWPKIPFQYPLALRHPKILEKCRKHHRILVSVRNRFWAPTPPAKADIATAILTNVIEHLVLLLPPNKHTFTAKAVWADLIHAYNWHLGIPNNTYAIHWSLFVLVLSPVCLILYYHLINLFDSSYSGYYCSCILPSSDIFTYQLL